MKFTTTFALFVRLWISKVRTSHTFSDSFNHSDFLLLSISWIFGNEEGFYFATKRAILLSKKDVEVPKGQPIPSAVIGEYKQTIEDVGNDWTVC